MWIYVFYICFFFLGRPSSGVNLLYWINAHSVVDSPPLIIRWLSIDQAVPYKEVDECYHCHSHVRLDRPLHLRSPASESTQRSYRSPFSWKIRPTQVNRWIKRKGKQGLHCGTERERSPIYLYPFIAQHAYKHNIQTCSFKRRCTELYMPPRSGQVIVIRTIVPTLWMA